MSIERAVENMILSAGLKPTDRLVVVGDDSIHLCAEELVRRAEPLVAKCAAFNLDRCGPRPLPALPDEIRAALDDCDVVFVLVRAAADGQTNELATVRRPIALHSERIKHINLPGSTRTTTTARSSPRGGATTCRGPRSTRLRGTRRAPSSSTACSATTLPAATA